MANDTIYTAILRTKHIDGINQPMPTGMGYKISASILVKKVWLLQYRPQSPNTGLARLFPYALEVMTHYDLYHSVFALSFSQPLATIRAQLPYIFHHRYRIIQYTHTI